MRGELEITLPQLRKPRMVINNVPKETTVANLEETIIAKNPELDLKPGEIYARFMYTTKREQVNTVIEVGPDTRRKLLQNKLKIEWQICNVAYYLVAMRCFKCSWFNHRHKDCKGEETCPRVRGRAQVEGMHCLH